MEALTKGGSVPIPSSARLPRRPSLCNGKATWPGRKQVYRRRDTDGRLVEDVVALADGDPQDGEPLLRPVMRGGRPLAPAEPLETAQARAATERAALPEPLRRLEGAPAFPVRISARLRALAEAT